MGFGENDTFIINRLRVVSTRTKCHRGFPQSEESSSSCCCHLIRAPSPCRMSAVICSPALGNRHRSNWATTRRRYFPAGFPPLQVLNPSFERKLPADRGFSGGGQHALFSRTGCHRGGGECLSLPAVDAPSPGAEAAPAGLWGGGPGGQVNTFF